MFNISELTEVESYYWNYWHWLNASKVGYLLDSEDCYPYYTVSSNKGKVAINTGYPWFLWNDRIYVSATGEDTGKTIKDLQ
jgi:hypothetical protein